MARSPLYLKFTNSVAQYSSNHLRSTRRYFVTVEGNNLTNNCVLFEKVNNYTASGHRLLYLTRRESTELFS